MEDLWWQGAGGAVSGIDRDEEVPLLALTRGDAMAPTTENTAAPEVEHTVAPDEVEWPEDIAGCHRCFGSGILEGFDGETYTCSCDPNPDA